MISAIEVYNKPSFKYREETFAVLAINAWELLAKAKWLAENKNDIKTLYVMEYKQKSDGTKSNIATVRLTQSGNPLTFGIRYVTAKLREQGHLTEAACANLDALIDMRDSAVHFYNTNTQFARILQEVGCATVKNFVIACDKWFGVTLEEFNFYLMPIAFLTGQERMEAIRLNPSERKVTDFIGYLDKNVDKAGDFSIAVSLSIKFDKSSDVEALKVRLSNDKDAMPVQLSDEQLRDRYPYVFRTLTQALKDRYLDFAVSPKYHKLRETLKEDTKYSYPRSLDPGNPRSPKTLWFSKSVFTVFDKHYKRRGET
jgi:hypothetical protein